MSSKFPFRLVVVAAIMAIGALSIQTKTASAVFGKKLVDQTGCPCFTCPSCKHTCNLESELVDVEKTCFEIEEKVICIPRVVFPWQKKSQSSCCGCTDQPCSNCTHNGAKTRKICVLKTKKFECPQCKYTWSPKEKECGRGSASGCCDNAGSAIARCAEAPCDAVPWSTQPVASSYDSGVEMESHPWTTAEPVVSELPPSHTVEYAVPAPVALP